MESIYKQESAKADGAVILTANIRDSLEGATAFMNSRGYTVPVLLDAHYGNSMLYGVSGVPMTVFIDRKGIIRYIKLGPFKSLSEIQKDLGKIT